MYNPLRADVLTADRQLRDARSGAMAAEPLLRDLEVREPAVARLHRWTLRVGRVQLEMRLAGS